MSSGVTTAPATPCNVVNHPQSRRKRVPCFWCIVAETHINDKITPKSRSSDLNVSLLTVSINWSERMYVQQNVPHV